MKKKPPRKKKSGGNAIRAQINGSSIISYLRSRCARREEKRKGQCVYSVYRQCVHLHNIIFGRYFAAQPSQPLNTWKRFPRNLRVQQKIRRGRRTCIHHVRARSCVCMYFVWVYFARECVTRSGVINTRIGKEWRAGVKYTGRGGSASHTPLLRPWRGGGVRCLLGTFTVIRIPNVPAGSWRSSG